MADFTYEFKGNSIIGFPKDYIVVDLETTGLNPGFNEIIEISAIKVSGDITSTYSTLIKPENEIDEFITDLTGITNAMVKNAPRIEEELPKFLDFIGSTDAIIVGHNVSFDINFLFTECELSGLPHFSNNFIDTLRIARKLLPQLKHHRLADIVNYYGLSYDGAHRAMVDCELTKAIFEKLHGEIEEGKEEEFIKSFKYHKKGIGGTGYVRTQNMVIEPIPPEEIDKDNLLYGRNICITGTLDKFERKHAHQLILNCGGIPTDSVTTKTDYLVLGDNSFCSIIKDGKSSKQKKAEALMIKGQDIHIIPESVFYELTGLL